jgi:flagellar hook-length control protein FliK
MPESTSNIFSMTPLVSLKTTGSGVGKSTLSLGSTFQESSSFSSKLSFAEDRQRRVLAEKNTADERDSSDKKQTVAPEAVAIREGSSSIAVVDLTTIADGDTAAKSSTLKGLLPGDTLSSDLVNSGTSSADVVTPETLTGELDKRSGVAVDESHISISKQKIPFVAEQGLTAAHAGEFALSGKLPNDKNLKELTSNEAIDAKNIVENNHVPSIEIPATDELTAITKELKSVAESEQAAPITGLVTAANSTESRKTATILTTDSALLSSSQSTTVSSGTLTQPASVPPVDTGENLATLPPIDKRLGRLSSTIESFVVNQPDSAVVQGETKNSLNIDANVMSLRNQALGLDGEQVLNQTIQQPGSEGEQAKGILISDLAQLNQSAGRSASSINDFAMSSSGANALDQMLTTSTGGIVAAPNLGKFDLTNLQNVSAPTPTPVPAPLNVPLLSSSASEVLSGNIRWMVGEGIQNATISVTPSGMGPITVQIGVEKDQMSISITASQSSTREALEATIPRLREQLITQGLESVRVDVSDGRSDQSKSNTGSDRQAMGGSSENSQQQSTENNNNESSTARFGNNNELGSGERVLSDTERDLLSQLQSLSTDPSVAQSTIRHGYDLYV